jgi:carboxyl-terminal processing protease
MFSRLQAALALILLLVVLAPASAEPEKPSRQPLQMAEVLATLVRVQGEHPSPPEPAFLVRAGMRGAVRQMQEMGLAGDSLFEQKLTGDLKADIMTIERALDGLLAGRSAAEKGQVLWAGLAEALACLEDPGTRLHPPGAYAATLAELGYSLGGVGFFVDEEKDEQGRLVIVELFEGFPAERQGICRGDRLVAVAGRPTADLKVNELIDIVRGPVGTRIELAIQRGDGPIKRYGLTREWLNPNPKGSESRLVHPRAGYVKVKYLGHRLHHDVRRQIEDLQAQGARSLILDLRNCPGVPAGAIGLTDLFLPSGRLVMTEIGRADQTDWKTSDPTVLELPTVVLINRYTSGAAALVAGALRDHGRAILVGEDTDPKEMQAFEKVAEELGDGSVATVTISYYRLPLGKMLWQGGLRADLEVPMPDPTVRATAGSGDLQFEKALELLVKP